MKVVETIIAYGHENIRATHKTTFEITKEGWLTKRGDCIVAVGANKSVADFHGKFKEALRKEGARLKIIFEVDGMQEVVEAWGSPQLLLTHPTDVVVRKSGHVCARTVGIKADKASKDFSRKLVEKLRNPKQKVKVTLTVESY